jgi:hypothetical protein
MRVSELAAEEDALARLTGDGLEDALARLTGDGLEDALARLTGEKPEMQNQR